LRRVAPLASKETEKIAKCQRVATQQKRTIPGIFAALTSKENGKFAEWHRLAEEQQMKIREIGVSSLRSPAKKAKNSPNGMTIGQICAVSLRSPAKKATRIRDICDESASRKRSKCPKFALARSPRQQKKQPEFAEWHENRQNLRWGAAPATQMMAHK
jgi:hypothetical protein